MSAENPMAVDPVASVDQAFILIFGASAVLLLLIMTVMVYFLWRYNRKRHPVPADIDGNFWAELIWTVLPTLLVMGMFYYGWTSYMALRTVPKDAMLVKVTARMWSWAFEYENGKRSDKLYVPVGRAVKLVMKSVDVLHGFFVPAFRIKVDTVPGMTTYAWFRAEKPGEHDIYCTVYCGMKHADMLSVVRALPPEEFERWLAEPAPGAGRGKQLLDANGCLSCHTLDGAASVGPSFKDMYNRSTVLVGADGKERTIKADEAYLKDAIVGEKKILVKGYDAVMPSYAGQIPDADLTEMLRYFKHGDAPSAAQGAAVSEREGCVSCHSTDGSALVGPSFKGLFGSTTRVVAKSGERETLVDKAYVFKSLEDPDSRRTKGYDPVMPAYPHLTEPEKDALVEYLKELAPSPANPPAAPASHDAHEHAGHGK